MRPSYWRTHLDWSQITRTTTKREAWIGLSAECLTMPTVLEFRGHHTMWIPPESCSHKGRWNQIKIGLHCLISLSLFLPPKEPLPPFFPQRQHPTPIYCMQGHLLSLTHLFRNHWEGCTYSVAGTVARLQVQRWTRHSLCPGRSQSLIQDTDIKQQQEIVLNTTIEKCTYLGLLECTNVHNWMLLEYRAVTKILKKQWHLVVKKDWEFAWLRKRHRNSRKREGFMHR